MTWLLGSWARIAIAGIIISVLVGGGLAGIRGCMRKEAENQYLKQTLKNAGLIDKNDKVVDQKAKQTIDELQKSIEGLPPDEQAKKIKEALDRYFGGNGK